VFKAQRYQPTGRKPEAKGHDGARSPRTEFTFTVGLLDRWKLFD
jgi:hypothetical protein